MTTEEQIAMLEAKTRELVERNRKLANQISGYSDRVQESIRPLLADAWDKGYKVGDTDRWSKAQDRRFENDNTTNPYRSNDE